MVLRFNLEIYSGIVSDFLAGQRNLQKMIEGGGFYNKTIQEIEKEGWINSEWLDFFVWYHNKEWGLFKKKLVFRGLREYSFGDLRRILKTGTDRTTKSKHLQMNPAAGSIMRHYNLKPEDFIFAGNLTDAWIVTNDMSNKSDRRIILAYNSRLLENITDFTYKLKRGVVSFKDALFAIIIIDYKIKK